MFQTFTSHACISADFLSFNSLILHLKNVDLQGKAGFFINRFPLHNSNMIVQATLLPVPDYRDVIYRQILAATLKPLDLVLFSDLLFILFS